MASKRKLQKAFPKIDIKGEVDTTLKRKFQGHIGGRDLCTKTLSFLVVTLLSFNYFHLLTTIFIAANCLFKCYHHQEEGKQLPGRI